MGHTSFAVIEVIGYGLTWLVFAAGVVGAINDPEAVVLAVFFLFLLAVQHVIDATLTYFVASKGLRPKGAPG
jgi:hypothetical protein